MRFKEVIGLENIKRKLIETALNKRICHAQLFLGPEGSGKLALAIAYAQYVNCENKLDDDSCGYCHSCRKFEKLIHPDLHLIFPNTSTKKVTKENHSQLFINEFKELLINKKYYICLNDWYEKLEIENKQGIINAQDCSYINKALSLKSYESEYTVIIIWLAEKLYHSAAPKILKILEEPPLKTLFLLVSEDHESILPTIKSRTQLIKIPMLEIKDIEKALTEREGVDNEKAKKFARISGGNYIEALKQIYQAEDEEILFNDMRQWLRLCYKIKIPELYKTIEILSSIGRESQKQYLDYTLNILREVFNFKFIDNYQIKHEGEQHNFIKDFSVLINKKNIFEITEEINRAIYHIERNANSKILFMDLSFKMNKFLN